MYYKLLSQMIRNWRDDWNDDELFFVIGQLPMHRWEADPDFKNWCTIREAQAKTARTTAGTALAVLTDAASSARYTPRTKRPRLTDSALRRSTAAIRLQFVDGEEGQEGGFSTFNPEAYEVCWTPAAWTCFVSTGFALR